MSTFRTLLIYLNLLFILISCHSGENTQPNTPLNINDLIRSYDIENDLDVYLKETFELQHKDLFLADSIFFIIPLNSCFSCLKYTLSSLEKNKFKGTILISSDTNEFQFEQSLTNYAYNQKTTLFDAKSNISNYMLGIGEPVAFLLRDSGLYKIDLSAYNWPAFSEHLKWDTPIN